MELTRTGEVIGVRAISMIALLDGLPLIPCYAIYLLTEIWTSSPTTRTADFPVATATGKSVGSPVRTWNAPPCIGHSTGKGHWPTST